ncbi:hypothetical protein SDC9_125612 [bioreactor metagenome]|uniref:Uncharacterized protein n=1 Tax=bioreactor metagenome TaxID=1076179 RepID=A0A645CNU4_9ZZZZ
MSHFKFYVASVRYLLRVEKTFRDLCAEEVPHFLRRPVVKVISPEPVPVPVRIIYIAVCLNTEKNVMPLSVSFTHVMNVVCCYQWIIIFLCNFNKLLVDYCLLRNTVMLKLQKEIPFAQYVPVEGGPGDCALHVTF